MFRTAGKRVRFGVMFVWSVSERTADGGDGMVRQRVAVSICGDGRPWGTTYPRNYRWEKEIDSKGETYGHPLHGMCVSTW